MKILIAGDWHSELHEEAMYRAFQELGHTPIRFAWYHYFKANGLMKKLTSIPLKFQGKYMLGPVVNKLNTDLIIKVEEENPDILFIYRGSHIYPETLKKIRQISKNINLLGYNNDDPFSPKYPKWKWRYFLAGVPKYDIIFAYRLHNLSEFKAAGAKRVELLRSWFIPTRNYPVSLNDSEMKKYGCDVTFVGHYEDDERVDYLRRIVSEGYVLKIWGPGYDWDPILKKIPELKNQVPVKLVWGNDYNRTICGAKIALCFHSKLNRDTYTRRNFEILASGTFMLSSYSEDLSELFIEGKEAEYFITLDELIEKISFYLKNSKARKKIAKSGYLKVKSAGHDVNSRMQYLLNLL